MADEKPAQETTIQQISNQPEAPHEKAPQPETTRVEPPKTEKPPQPEVTQVKPPQPETTQVESSKAEKPQEKLTPRRTAQKKMSQKKTSQPNETTQQETPPRKPKTYRGPPPRKNLVVSPMKEKDWKGNGWCCFSFSLSLRSIQFPNKWKFCFFLRVNSSIQVMLGLKFVCARSRSLLALKHFYIVYSIPSFALFL